MSVWLTCFRYLLKCLPLAILVMVLGCGGGGDNTTVIDNPSDQSSNLEPVQETEQETEQEAEQDSETESETEQTQGEDDSSSPGDQTEEEQSGEEQTEGDQTSETPLDAVLSASGSQAAANGSDALVVTLTINGNQEDASDTADNSVSFSQNGSAQFGTVVANGNGQYQASVTNLMAETVTVGAVVNGEAISDTLSLTFYQEVVSTATCDLSQYGLTGTTYYICDCQQTGSSDLPDSASGCVAGDDNNPGTDPDAPKRSYAAAVQLFNQMQPGDTIAFCEGGVFQTRSQCQSSDPSCRRELSNHSCLPGQRCAMTSYTPPWAQGGENNPAIVFSQYSMDIGNGQLVDQGANGIHFNDSGAGQDGGYVLSHLDIYGDTGTESAFGVFLIEGVDDLFMCDLTVDGFGVGVHYHENANKTPPATNSRIELTDSTISNNVSQGFLGSCSDCEFENNLFDNNGTLASAFYHSFYLGAGDSTADNVVIRNNEFTNNVHNSSGQCSGTILVAHGYLGSVLIEGNRIVEATGSAQAGCWGIGIVPAYASAEHFEQITIRGNWVENVGNTAIAAGACQDCLLENNVVVHDQGYVTGISLGTTGKGTGDGDNEQVTIRNNTVFLGSSASGTGIEVTEKSQLELINNALYHQGTSNWNCFNLNNGSGGNISMNASVDVMDNNLCYSATVTGEWVIGSGDLAQWHSTSGFDTQSLASDPQFISTSGELDLHPGQGSPLIDAGSGSDVSEDHDGNGRSLPLDIGAYESLTMQ